MSGTSRPALEYGQLLPTSRANPVGQLWAAVMMLDRLGEHEASGQLWAAVESSVAAGRVTPDLGGTLTTGEIEREILERLGGRDSSRG